MARIHGEAGDTEFKKSRRMFIRMMLFLLVTGMVTAFIGGIVLIMANLWVTIPFLLIELLLLWQLNARSDKHINEMVKHIKGASGESQIGLILEELPDDYCVFHDLSHHTMIGNFDHIVVGPTGVFAIETKNWRGTVVVDRDTKELLLNGKPCDKNYAGVIKSAAMTIKGKIDTLTGGNTDLFVKAVMVFPNSYIDYRNGSIPLLDLKHKDNLIEHLTCPKVKRMLKPDEVKKVEQALIALMTHRQE